MADGYPVHCARLIFHRAEKQDLQNKIIALQTAAVAVQCQQRGRSSRYPLGGQATVVCRAVRSRPSLSPAWRPPSPKLFLIHGPPASSTSFSLLLPFHSPSIPPPPSPSFLPPTTVTTASRRDRSAPSAGTSVCPLALPPFRPLPRSERWQPPRPPRRSWTATSSSTSQRHVTSTASTSPRTRPK